jgi:hypothetical protein
MGKVLLLFGSCFFFLSVVLSIHQTHDGFALLGSGCFLAGCIANFYPEVK